jgi:hypothetical protein
VIKLTGIDWKGMRDGPRMAKAELQQEIQFDRRLAHRRVGLVLTFGGAKGVGTETAEDIAEKVNAALKELGARGFAFDDAAYEKAYHDLSNPPSTILIHVWVFKNDARAAQRGSSRTDAASAVCAVNSR